MKPDVAPARLAFAFVLAVAAGSGAAACHSSSPEVVVYTSVDQVFSEPVFRAFEAATGLTVRPVFDTEETKSTGVLNRLVDVASGIQDTWADPRAEYASAYHASPVYRLLGKNGLGSEKLPPLGKAILDGDVGYHVREGGHSVELYDWQRFMDFADRHLKDCLELADEMKICCSGFVGRRWTWRAIKPDGRCQNQNRLFHPSGTARRRIWADLRR